MGNDCLQSTTVVLQYLRSVFETDFENLEASVDIWEKKEKKILMIFHSSI